MWSSELSRAENEGLSDGLSLIEDVKKEIDSISKGGPISYADLIQLAGDDVIAYAKNMFMNRIIIVVTEIFLGLVSIGQSAVKSTFLASAIRKCGGNEEKGNLLYTAYGSAGQVNNAILCVLSRRVFFKSRLNRCESVSGACLIEISEGVMQLRQIQKAESHSGVKQLCKRWKISSLPLDWVLVRYMIMGFKIRLSDLIIQSN